ncbi:MAG TPA: hypothetical protein VKT78_20500 [Fimbriimonadaceae bacterium]|nr:hypothetical protein [Fimbriimonadaceae bacterium]
MRDELRVAYEAVLSDEAETASRSTQRADRLSPIRKLIDAGQYTDAVRAIMQALQDEPEPLLRLRLLDLYTEYVGDSLVSTDGLETSTYEAILDDAEKAELDEDLCRFLEQRVRRLAGAWKYAEALELLQGRLRTRRRYANLWFQLGRVRWGEDRFADAYTAISLALTLGFNRQVGLLTRGQILADWGRMPEASADLSGGLVGVDDPALAGPSHAAYALALGVSGNEVRCREEFKAADETGGHHNSLTQYFQARLLSVAVADQRRTLDMIKGAALADADLGLLNPSQVISLIVAAQRAYEKDETLDGEVVEVLAWIWETYVRGPLMGFADERWKVDAILRADELWARVRDKLEADEMTVGDGLSNSGIMIWVWSERFRRKFYTG